MTERSSGMRWHCSSYIRVWFQPNWHLLFPFCIPGCHPVNSRNSRKTGDTCLWGIVSPWSSVLLQPWYGSYIFLEGPSSILLSFTSITNFTFSLKYPIADACTFRLCLSQLHLYFISHSLAYNSLNDKPSLCCHVFLFAGSNMTIKLEIRAHVIHLFFTLHPLFCVFQLCDSLLPLVSFSLSALSSHMKLLADSVFFFSLFSLSYSYCKISSSLLFEASQTDMWSSVLVTNILVLLSQTPWEDDTFSPVEFRHAYVTLFG